MGQVCNAEHKINYSILTVDWSSAGTGTAYCGMCDPFNHG